MTSYQNLLLLSIGFYTATSHADLRYRVVSIGDLFGGLDYSMPYCINDFGQVTGQSYVTGNNLAPFVWTAATGIQFLPISIACSPYGGLPHDQNDAGTIVGTGGNEACQNEAVRWTANTGTQYLGDLPGGVFWSVGHAINSAGHIVGSSMGGLPVEEPYLWTPEDGMIRLGMLPGYENDGTLAESINDSDFVVGRSAVAFYWTAATGMRPLAELAAAQDFFPQDAIVNNAFQIAGVMFYPGARQRGYFLEPDGTVINFGQISPDPQEYIMVFDLNNHGTVCATAVRSDSRGEWVPFLWNRERGVFGVHEQIDPCVTDAENWLITYRAINDRGWITGERLIMPDYIPLPGIVLIPYIPGDLDENEICDLQDLAILLSNFSRAGDAEYQHGDLDCDQDVDLQDLAILLANFGESLP